MQGFPEDFLKKLAKEKGLTPAEKEAFLEIFGNGRSAVEAQEALGNIGENALSTRMNGVYSKFSFGGKRPNKSHELRKWLTAAYKKVEPNASTADVIDDMEALVRRLRSQGSVSIQNRCGEMRVLDMKEPMDIDTIYTDVEINIADLNLDRLKEICSPEQFAYFMNEQRMTGLMVVELKKQLIILGRLGSGKTTFLKRLAMLCNRGNFLANQVPIFIELKFWAQIPEHPRLITFIAQELSASVDTIHQMLQAGHGLILLDGWDEISDQDHDRVLTEIQQFAQDYSGSHIVMTCRIAAREYIFQQFTEVEIADFNPKQINIFTKKWFSPHNSMKTTFLNELEKRPSVKDWASNPLLLTLLCLRFKKLNKFPDSRLDLYDQVIEILLTTWNNQKQIRRKSTNGVSKQQKKLILECLALETFRDVENNFKKRRAIDKIEQCLSDLNPQLPLQIESEDILKDFVVHHGILMEKSPDYYAFIHLVFHEYFVACKINKANPTENEEALDRLLQHSSDHRWYEIFILILELSEASDKLLKRIKDKIDGILANDEQLQNFLSRLHQKSDGIEVDDRRSRSSVRAYYYALVLNLMSERESTLDQIFDLQLARRLSQDLDQALDHALDINYARSLVANKGRLARIQDSKLTLDLELTLDLDMLRILNLAEQFIPENFPTLILDLDLASSLENRALEIEIRSLREQLPTPLSDLTQIEQWWLSHGEAWTQQFRQIMIEHRNIGHDWQLSRSQQDLLQKYYDANKLLVDCLKSECSANRQVLKHIENTLLLPLAEIPVAPL